MVLGHLNLSMETHTLIGVALSLSQSGSHFRCMKNHCPITLCHWAAASPTNPSSLGMVFISSDCSFALFWMPNNLWLLVAVTSNPPPRIYGWLYGFQTPYEGPMSAQMDLWQSLQLQKDCPWGPQILAAGSLPMWSDQAYLVRLG